jgi:hypothetical protein
MSLVQGRSLLCAAVLIFTTGAGWGQDPNPSVHTNLTADQIVDQIERHNQSQAEALKHYETIRHYQVEYRGFGSTLAARMEVEVRFDAAAGLSYRILSQSGSKILCDKVLRRALDSEKEASRDKAATALTPANYRFRLEKVESLDQRPEYVLDVEPLTGNKFLYRGKIWVDATDFAVKKIEAEPAKNPSFWISRTQIRYTSAKVGGFWLPERNQGEDWGDCGADDRLRHVSGCSFFGAAEQGRALGAQSRDPTCRSGLRRVKGSACTQNEFLALSRLSFP